MGNLTDFVVANREEAELVGSAENLESFECLQARNVDQIKIGVLYARITGTEFNNEFFNGEPLFPPDFEDGDNWPWVFQVPDDFVRVAAELTPERISQVATESSQDEEFNGWGKENIEQTLNDLCQICKKAGAQNKNLLLLLCI